jgi:hypothetical protein
MPEDQFEKICNPRRRFSVKTALVQLLPKPCRIDLLVFAVRVMNVIAEQNFRKEKTHVDVYNRHGKQHRRSHFPQGRPAKQAQAYSQPKNNSQTWSDRTASG